MTKHETEKGRQKRSPAKVRLGNLRVTPHCAKVIRRHAEKLGTYPADAIADVLEGWVKRQEVKRQRERKRKAGGKPHE